MSKSVEVVRARHRPRKITTLFVGESPPDGGTFFYRGDSGLYRHMRSVIEGELGKTDDFLATFKSYGWYLDDLVLTPVNNMERDERRRMCRDARPSLAKRIAKYRPQAIVSLLIGIERDVSAAAIAAGSTARFYAVPFPGRRKGQPEHFRAAGYDRRCRLFKALIPNRFLPLVASRNAPTSYVQTPPSETPSNTTNDDCL